VGGGGALNTKTLFGPEMTKSNNFCLKYSNIKSMLRFYIIHVNTNCTVKF
jgi:hypothetical protein